MSAKCLYCYKPLAEGHDFHAPCSNKIFGSPKPPILPYGEEDLKRLAWEIIQSQAVLTGVQAKISLHITDSDIIGDTKKFTIVGLPSGYILKPSSPHYAHLPENEDLTMHLAAIAGIKTVPHSLIRLKSGSLAYITKRIDRVGEKKIHMEDMCQLTEKLTEYKYKGSHEQVAKVIKRHSDNPGLDLVSYYELVLFCFLTGNSDMHLKNFSLIRDPGIGISLSPAYDLLSVALVIPEDKEDLALTLNGKKSKLNRKDFTAAFTTSGGDAKQQENIFVKMQKSKGKWFSFIDSSFLPADYKENYKNLIENRFGRLGF